MSSFSLNRTLFDPYCQTILDSAVGQAELTDCECIQPSHLFLALASDGGGYLDRLLSEDFEGLRADTVADSLSEILETADPGEGTGDEAPGMFSMACGQPAAEVLLNAVKRAEAWDAPRATTESLALAVLDDPDAFLVLAFADARITPKMLSESVRKRTKEPPDERTAPVVFDGDTIRMDAFGPVAREALRTLTQLRKPLTAEHMLIAFLAHEESRANDALHLMGLQPEAILRSMTQIYGEPEGPRGFSLEVKSLTRLLKGVIEKSAKIALEDRCAVVGESQLVRSFIGRVAASRDNVLSRFRINPERLRSYLELYTVDREWREREGQIGMVQDIKGILSERVIGQDKAIATVLPALESMRLGMGESGRLMGVFLFLGATGVGKTELAKAIADAAFGPKPGVRDPYLIRIDCGRLESRRDIVQLLGAPQGLVGYKEGALTNGLRDKGNRCVILFDEAEKADPSIWQSLLTFFDEGIVTEADGTLHDATGCILIATSNLGYKDAIQNFGLFDLSAEQLTDVQPQLQAFVWKHVTEYFSPEFRGRFGRQNVIFFNHFRREDYRAMISRQMGELQKEMAEKGIEVTMVPELFDILVEIAWEGRENGARDVRRTINTHVRNAVVEAVREDPTVRAVEVGISTELQEYQRLHEERARLQAQTAPANLEAFLNERIVNQEHAVGAVVPALKRMRAGLNEPGRLMGSFLFLGATGVGKTELSRAIAEVTFGAKQGIKDPYLILINCGVLKEPRDTVQVLGAPQGLVGYKEGILTNGLRDKGNRCVILFDEAEKAHPQIWQSLLQLFDEGVVIEADGTQYDATGCVLVATSNLGYKEAIEQFRLFDRSASEQREAQPKVEEFVWKKVAEYFSPEFLGRFGRENVIFFNHFGRDAYRNMLETRSEALVEEMARKDIEVRMDPAVLEALTELAWAKRNEGARPVRRLVTTYLRDRVVEARAEDPTCRVVDITVSGELERAHRERLAAVKRETVVDLEQALNACVVAQEHAVAAVVPAVRRMRQGMNEPGRLIGSFLFIGPSGVGKTELAKGIADAAFGAKPGVVDAHLIRIDCGKLSDRRDIVQLLGAPQGLVGYKEGALTSGLRDKGGRCVILFDEAEKASPHIWQSLLTFFDEGIVTEADGTRYDATGCILIATSNLGYKDAIEAFNLFAQPHERLADLRPQIEELIWGKISGYFSPEFLGRFGRENVILFNHFSEEHYRSMLVTQAGRLTEEMQERGLDIVVDPEVIAALTAKAWEKRSEGARTVRRLITTCLRDQVVDGLSSDPGRTTFHFHVREDGKIMA